MVLQILSKFWVLKFWSKSPNIYPEEKSLLLRFQEHLEHYWKTYFHHHFDPKSLRRWFSPRGSNLFGAFEKFNRVPLVRCTYLFVKSSWYCMLILRTRNSSQNIRSQNQHPNFVPAHCVSFVLLCFSLLMLHPVAVFSQWGQSWFDATCLIWRCLMKR